MDRLSRGETAPSPASPQGAADAAPGPRGGKAIHRTIFERMGVGCAHCRMLFAGEAAVDWLYLDVNPAFEAWMGLKEVTGRRVSELVPGLLETSPGLFASLGRVARTGAPESLEVFVPRLGQWRALQAFCPAPGEVVITFDRTVNAERDLRLAEERLALALSACGMGTFDWDIIRDVRHFDAAFHRLVGLPQEPFKGSEQEFYRVIHPEDRDRVRASLPRAVRDGHYETEYRAVRPDGSIRHIAARGKVVLDPQGRPARLNGVAWDITERKQAEEDLRRFEERAHRAQALEALGVLVAGVAHNLNNVLAVILGTASLREVLTADSADLDAYRTIGKVCQRGREVVKSLIQFSQPTLAVHAPFELHGVIREVAVLLENTTRNRVRIVQALADEPLWIHGEAGSFNLALVNLCFNAMEAMPGGGTLALRTAADGAGWVEVSVEDNGRGMTEEVRAHMLEPFFTTKDASSGAGLGLSMVYGVIKAHGGTVDIASQPGQGTSVKLRLPRIPAPGRCEPARAPGPAHGLGRVLLVDDEEDVRFLMARLLRKAGVAQVETAAGGAEALARLCAEPLPDVVILDQNMPGMTGIQAMARIRALHPDLPILFSSGQPGIADWDCLKRPRTGVISKPFTIEEIQEALALLAGKGPA